MLTEPHPEFYRALLEESPQATLVYGADRLCRWASPAFTRWVARDPSAYRERDIASLMEDVHPDDRRQAQEAWDSFWAVRAGRAQPGGPPLPPVTFTLRLRLRSGDHRLVELTALNRLEDPAVAGLVLHFTQLVDAKNAEDLLVSERERLTVTLRSIAEGVVASDVDGRVTLLNGAAEELTGWTQAEAVGRRLSEVLPLTAEGPGSPRKQLVSRTGKASTVEDSAAPIRDGAGRTMGSVVVFRDVTESRRTASELLKMQKLESIGVLAGGIAHDFNNLLSAVLGNASLATLLVDPGHPVQDLLNGIQQATRRASGLTQQLLTFSKGGTPVLEPTRVQELVPQVAGFLLQGTSCELRFDFAPDLSPVMADPGQLGQVVRNLVLNASQAMTRGGLIVVRGSNAVLASSSVPPLVDGHYVRLDFADEGPGIEPGHLEKIFEPYFTTKPTASGLGLAVVWSVVKGHGGWVEAQSRVGEGTTLTVWLPVASPQHNTHARPHPGVRVRKGQVLVMDDEAEPRKTMAVMLRHLGFDCLEAATGEAALVLLAENPGTVLALVDLTVKVGMGGKEALPRMKAQLPPLKVLVTSGYSIDPVMANPLAHGFDGGLKKPFSLADLTLAVDAALAR